MYAVKGTMWESNAVPIDSNINAQNPDTTHVKPILRNTVYVAESSAAWVQLYGTAAEACPHTERPMHPRYCTVDENNNCLVVIAF